MPSFRLPWLSLERNPEVSDYLVNLPDGRQLRVPMPERLTVRRPMSDDQARAAIHKFIKRRTTTLVEPFVTPRPTSHELIRNESGQIVRSVVSPAASAAEVAAEIGELAANRYVSEIEW